MQGAARVSGPTEQHIDSGPAVEITFGGPWNPNLALFLSKSMNKLFSSI